jgi:mono/diheme cytochrome c family protein
MNATTVNRVPRQARIPGGARRAPARRVERLRAALCFIALLICMAAADGSWLRSVPPDYHSKANPLAGQPAAIAGGELLFADRCAKCHGKDALGRGKRPSLRSERVQSQATEGDIFWLLKNGNLRRGMPTWSAMPEPSRWQIIAYVKSLGPESASAPGKKPRQEKSK